MGSGVGSRRAGASWVPVLALIVLLGAVGCGGGSDVPIPTEDWRKLRDEAAKALFTGDDDFAAAEEKLERAKRLAPFDDDATRILLAKARFLGFAKEEMTADDGTLRGFYERMGYVNAAEGASFWDMDLVVPEQAEPLLAASLDEGEIMDAAPNGDELRAFLVDAFIPRLADVAEALAPTRSSFEYVVDANMGGRFFEQMEQEDILAYRWDYGDVMAEHAAVLAALSSLSLVAAYDPDGLRPNDFDKEDHPGLNDVQILYADYPDAGRIKEAFRFEQARRYLEQSWVAYLAASAHIRGETTDQAANGILSLGRDLFDSPQQRQDVLADEAEARVRGQSLTDSLRIDAPHTLDFSGFGAINTLVGDVDVTAVETLRLNLYRLFEGLDLREIYFKTVINPFTGNREFGVTDWDNLTDEMVTLGGVFLGVASRTPTPGDVASLGYAVRLDSPPSIGYSIDGVFSDWNTSTAAQLGGSASALPDNAEVHPDLGNIFVSVHGESLFLYIDKDLTTYMAAEWQSYTVEVHGPGGSATLLYSAEHSSHATYSSAISLEPLYAHVPGHGIEIGFPLGSEGPGEWASVKVTVRGTGPDGDFESQRERMYVKVR